MKIIAYQANKYKRVGLWRRALLLVTVACSNQFADLCWNQEFSEHYCCGGDRKNSCFDSTYTYERCCRSQYCPPGTFAFQTKTVARSLLCLRGGHEIIDNTIFNFGFWSDCNVLHMIQSMLTDPKSPTCQRPLRYLDVGANIGACSMQAAMEGWEVVAVEPHPVHVDMMQGSRSLNALSASNPFIIQAAALENPGEVLLWGVKYNSGASSILRVDTADAWVKSMGFFGPTELDEHFVVRGIRLDSIDGSFGFLKIDVEGHEGPALHGGEGILLDVARRPVVIYFEHSPIHITGKGLDPTEPFRFLQKHGYRMFVYEDDHLGGSVMWGELKPWEVGLSNLFTWTMANVYAVLDECTHLFLERLHELDLTILANRSAPRRFRKFP